MNVSASTRALLAGLVWVTGGGFLLYRGWKYYDPTVELSGTTAAYIAIALGVAIGAAKGFFVLRKSARRLIHRIEAQPRSAPVWNIYPPYFYPLLAAMIGMGFAVRYFFGSTNPGLVLGVYLGIGAALFVSSLPFFSAASRLRTLPQA